MRVGIVGFGNMGQAFGLCLARAVGKENVTVTDRDPSKRNLALELGLAFAADLKFLLDTSDLVLIAVKPKDAPEVLSRLGEARGKILVSLMAGVSIEDIERMVGKDKKIVRIMPNVAVAVGKGTIAITDNGKLTEEERKKVEEILGRCGTLYRLEERYFDPFTALAGSGPAFVLSFIDGLSLAGVREGFPYQLALRIVLDTLEGTALLLKERGVNPNELITTVTSPGGTTIEGLKFLEEKGFKGLLMGCIEKTTDKARKLKK
ncbi:MAG: pyrroline-5-carboxylate reductase [Aquificae bacterium]|nr:pyrroline-5-carboxylate reductase [Aquificota bacterium]